MLEDYSEHCLSLSDTIYHIECIGERTHTKCVNTNQVRCIQSKATIETLPSAITRM